MTDVPGNPVAVERAVERAVALDADIAEGECVRGVVQGRAVAVARVDGRLYAVDNRCLHRQGPLSEGRLAGPMLTCPLHWWRYDVRTGELIGHPTARLTCYPVRVEDGQVLVTAPPAEPVRSWRQRLLDAAKARS